MLPWTAPLPDGGDCPGGRLKFTNLGPATPNQRSATKNGFTYYVHPIDTADVTGDGRPDTVVRLACFDGFVNQASWFYLYTVSGKKPVLLDFVTGSDERGNADYAVLAADARPGAVDVTEFVRGEPELIPRTFTWDGATLTADRPLPRFPEADIAP